MSLQSITGCLDFDPDELKAKYDYEREKRLRPEGDKQYLATTDRYARYRRDPWINGTLSREPIYDHTEVLIAGGGFGGLLVAARLRAAGCKDIRIVEVAGDFGGTWYWNRYPGAMCDIEAHCYMPLLEELHYAPKHRYAYAPELLEHSQRIGVAYGLYEKACFQTTITGADWLDLESRWQVKTDRGDVLTANYLVISCGRQSLPKLPDIPGIETFEGHTFHSSRWDYSYTGGDCGGGLANLADKKVGIVGTGATAVQIVPEVAKWAGELLVFQRTPSVVGVRGQCVTGLDWVDHRPGWQEERRLNFQRILTGEAQQSDQVNDGWTKIMSRLTLPSTKALSELLGYKPSREDRKRLAEIYDYRVMNELRARVEDVVTDPATADLLKPWYRWLCKRPCFHDDYLQAFNLDNVRLIDTQGQGIQGLTARTVIAGGKEFEVDCLVFATGFEAGISYTVLTGFDIRGRTSILSEHWANGVRTLHGLYTDGFPNLFFAGANRHTALPANVTHLVDEQAKQIAYVIGESRAAHRAIVEPTPESVDAYTQIIRNSPTAPDQIDFLAECTPGYFNGEGKAREKRVEDLFAGGRYGGGPVEYYDMLAQWRMTGRLEGVRMH